MGAEETDRMLTLLARLKATHAILLVEHDMDAVFRIADRITVMVNGTVIATGNPKRFARTPKCAPPTSEKTSLNAHRPRPQHLLRQQPHPARRARRHSGGHLGRPARAQRHGQDHADPHDDGLRAPRFGRSAGRRPHRHRPAAREDGAAGHRLRARGPRHLPEPVGAREPRDERTRRHRRPARVDLRPRDGHLSAPRRSGCRTAASSCRAASSRCCRSAAHS